MKTIKTDLAHTERSKRILTEEKTESMQAVAKAELDVQELVGLADNETQDEVSAVHKSQQKQNQKLPQLTATHHPLSRRRHVQLTRGLWHPPPSGPLRVSYHKRYFYI